MGGGPQKAGGSAVTGRLELTVLETAAAVRARADARIAERLASLGPDLAVSCAPGCFACCHQLVVVSPLEAHALAEYVRRDPALAARVEERTASWEESIGRDSELSARVRAFEDADGYLEGPEGAQFEAAYWRAQLPCVFLDEGGRCSVYEVRPLACREHHVLSDPVLCARDPDAAAMAGTRIEFRAVASEVGARCFGLPDRLILLARALRYAATHAAEGGRSASRSLIESGIASAEARVRRALALLALHGIQRR
jgi:Fe-S-cluster containining protein